IAAEIEENIYNKMNRRSARSEFRSWENSLEYMYKVLNDTEIPMNSGIAIEYNIPQTSKRVDFIISGYGENKESNVVIIELKQWDKVDAVSGQDALVETFTGGAVRKVVHPSYQAWSYAAMIYDYNQNVQLGNIVLHPCAYMHNYRKGNSEKLEENQYREYVEDAPFFGRGEVSKLRDFIKKSVKTGDDKQLLYDIDNGKIKPSKSLQDSIKGMIEGNQEFIMLDEQKVVYEEILSTSLECVADQKKRTVIVKGGPGTGKTVVAINLLAKLTNEGLFVQYTSKNSAPRNVYAKKLTGHRKSSINNMFKGAGSYIDAEGNIVDIIICDEGHRLTAKTQLGPKIAGENQIKEIINASLCSVFFIDESQRVTLNDIGTVDEIKKWAELLDSHVSEMELTSQFRCNGSDGYLAWLDDTLEIRETANCDMWDIDYDIKIVDSPNEVRNLIIERNKVSNHSRILAGYCWEWLKAQQNNTTYHDIKINDFEMSWNLGNSTTFE
ncbi:DNA/RNA helicase domain-containing protein, partial [Anaerosporobacter sp.]|uniref:DNA/RNA helicase domain-containing protein n=1 Tax=Anaerosporobacter sp. TaxID=1872529 RepID=UPI00286EEA30